MASNILSYHWGQFKESELLEEPPDFGPTDPTRLPGYLGGYWALHIGRKYVYSGKYQSLSDDAYDMRLLDRNLWPW